MNQENESLEWVTNREKDLNKLLYKSIVWSQLMGSGQLKVQKGLCRLLESLVYTIGTGDILEIIVDQDVSSFCKIEERLQHKLQVIIFTQKRVCIGTLEKPDNPNSVRCCTLNRSNIKRLSLYAVVPAFDRPEDPERQQLCITAEYDGLPKSLVIGSQGADVNRVFDYQDDASSFLKKMIHISQLIIDDLDS